MPERGDDMSAVSRSSLRIARAHEGAAGPVLVACDPRGEILLLSTGDGPHGVCRWDTDTGALLWRAQGGGTALAAVRLAAGRWVAALSALTRAFIGKRAGSTTCSTCPCGNATPCCSRPGSRPNTRHPSWTRRRSPPSAARSRPSCGSRSPSRPW
ncbi:hypothetical protein SBRY_40136 [Actinacidiphila bryophytorum]|uniref:Uncharacterized protein n=1 Tax=Actinacidiphila bryophytorum TaxID=1436133 RepID=A0A9W4H2D0_9ACTN|nr:hypothetical protein SBRY_40136 [Actinacidiphila bryophytorum]